MLRERKENVIKTVFISMRYESANIIVIFIL